VFLYFQSRSTLPIFDFRKHEKYLKSFRINKLLLFLTPE